MPFKKYFSSASPRAGLLAISIIVFAGCASKSGATGKNYTMGQAATAGALT